VADHVLQLAGLALEPAAALLQPGLDAIDHAPMMARERLVVDFNQTGPP